MTDEVKLRLYVTAIVIVMATLYVGPFAVTSHFNEVEQALLQDCLKELELASFNFCWDKSGSEAELPFWEYLLPYVPAGLALWFNWLVKPGMRLSDTAYPKRTINVLMWFGLLVGAWAVWLPFSEVVSRNVADLYKIQSLIFWRAPWIAAAWLMSPMLFHHLLAPIPFAASMRKGKIGLWLLAATPAASFALYVIRHP